MQNKGLIKLFAFLFGAVSIYQLAFTFKANQIEDQAKTYAISKYDNTVADYQTKRSQEEINYLDSLKTTKVKVDDKDVPIDVYDIGVAQFSYKDVEDNAMKLGLDLKGGINAIIEISVKDILYGLANKSRDATFNKALDDAIELQKNSQDPYLESFFVAFDAIKGDKKLASPDIFAHRDMVGIIERDMDDDEVNYAFKAAKALGAKGITLERSDAAMQRLAPFASEHKLNIGYHNHAKVNFESWDKGLELSDYNAVNLDIGHYVAGTNESPIPLIKKYHNRITNLHLKDRKKDNGPNMPWGEGDTPIGEVMRLLRDEKYDFLAAIELEYKIPEGSDAVKEVKNCIDFVKDALA